MNLSDKFVYFHCVDDHAMESEIDVVDNDELNNKICTLYTVQANKKTGSMAFLPILVIFRCKRHDGFQYYWKLIFFCGFSDVWNEKITKTGQNATDFYLYILQYTVYVIFLSIEYFCWRQW